jgi:hypothetical protein
VKPRLLPALLLAATAAATAQTVYRCGPDGSDYRQTPCPGGQAVQAVDPRSEVQRNEATQRAQRDAALLQELRRDPPATGAADVKHPPTARAQPAPGATAQNKPAARRHGKRRRPADDARMARGPKPEQSKPAKADKQDKAAPTPP